MIHRDRDGTVTLADDADPTRTQVLASDATDADIAAAVAAFFSGSLAMPEEVPMHQLRMFLRSTNRLTQVTNFLNSLPEPNKGLANDEFSYAPNFVPASALGRAAQAALGLNDADYAEAVRDAAAFTIDDYGDPKPTLLAALAKFFLGP